MSVNKELYKILHYRLEWAVGKVWACDWLPVSQVVEGGADLSQLQVAVGKGGGDCNGHG